MVRPPVYSIDPIHPTHYIIHTTVSTAQPSPALRNSLHGLRPCFARQNNSNPLRGFIGRAIGQNGMFPQLFIYSSMLLSNDASASSFTSIRSSCSNRQVSTVSCVSAAISRSQASSVLRVFILAWLRMFSIIRTWVKAPRMPISRRRHARLNVT
jgi:hypothetical protein